MRQLTIYDQPIEKHYHDTVPLPVKELIEKEAKAKKQEDIILEIFKIWIMLSPTQLMREWEKGNNPVPITSLRRGITNLTNAGYLVKTSVLVKGNYSDNEHVWKII